MKATHILNNQNNKSFFLNWHQLNSAIMYCDLLESVLFFIITFKSIAIETWNFTVELSLCYKYKLEQKIDLQIFKLFIDFKNRL